ncbi:hypothetical protein HELRODRAFT_161900 [Helobdella robusta]|uniref:IBR domain-containing protein n=1 Tax=Helobdella robusta TaxID=6412 RepID=T1ES07_HELRO|nr:hypothetical protein HELRODRAFT_161900 [Helobdella robusta]ESO02611.1 hypothetical protein HELRODRAFT_161900 [Helobdella robusta]
MPQSGHRRFLRPRIKMVGFEEKYESSLKDIESLEINLNNNVINDTSCIKQCPRCLIYIRNTDHVTKIKCLACDSDFCWECLQIFTIEKKRDNDDDGTFCQNIHCGNKKTLKSYKCVL